MNKIKLSNNETLLLNDYQLNLLHSRLKLMTINSMIFDPDIKIPKSSIKLKFDSFFDLHCFMNNLEQIIIDNINNEFNESFNNDNKNS